MERVEYITCSEYIEVLTHLYASLIIIMDNLESRNPRSLISVNESKKEILDELGSISADEERELVVYGWRSFCSEIITGLSEKLEHNGNGYTSLLVTSEYHSLNRKVIEVTTNNVLREIMQKESGIT